MSRHLIHATFLIAISTPAIIIIAIATTTKVPYSDKHSLQKSEITLLEVSRTSSDAMQKGLGNGLLRF
jgi:hypothetical protein